jgi:hypothetical protein
LIQPGQFEIDARGSHAIEFSHALNYSRFGSLHLKKTAEDRADEK